MSSDAGFAIDYRIRNEHRDRPPRRVEVPVSRDDLAKLAKLADDGYLVREGLIAGDMLAALRDACDSAEAEELARGAGVGSEGFSGLFVRNLVDRHEAFARLLLKFRPTLGLARAALGPQVQVHASVLHVGYGDRPNKGVQWHFHRRVVPDPVPPFFYRPCVLDNLIYLDDVTDDSGPLVVLPGTHKLDRDLFAGEYGDFPGRVTVTCPAGSVVTAHGATWHKAMPTKPAGGKRRLLILAYSPTWMKQVSCPRKAIDALPADADEETRELLGVGGFL